MIRLELIQKFYEREKKLCGVYEQSRIDLSSAEQSILDIMVKDFKTDKYPDRKFSDDFPSLHFGLRK